MMEKPVVVLFDNVANAYKDPFYPPTRGVALREFQDAVNNPQNAQLYNHASDFDLYVIGSWDEQTGVMSVFDKAEKLANCASLKTERDLDLAKETAETIRSIRSGNDA